MLSLLELIAALSVVLAGSSTLSEVVTIVTTAPVTTVDPAFVCVTMDWWPANKYSNNPGSHYPWGNASILHADFDHPTLRDAIQALAPVNLRVGGSLADQVLYDGLEPLNEPCKDFHANASAYNKMGYSGGCLPLERWDALHDMCESVGCSVIFGLNALVGRSPANTTERWSGDWNSSNAMALLQYTSSRGYKTLAGVELGNELDGAAGIAGKLPPETVASDFTRLRRMVNQLWSEGERPLVIGPDSSGFNDAWWYPELLGNLSSGVIDVITWHLYLLGSGNSTQVPSEIMNATYLNTLAPKLIHHTQTVAQFDPNPLGTPLWLGEGGGAYGSGQFGSTNTFLSGFWWLDSLGTFAYQGHGAVCRQALVGGNYELLNASTYLPNPDYYTTYLWRHLMGRTVLEASTVIGVGGSGTQGDLRTYAHCSPQNLHRGFGVTEAGSISIALINLANDYQVVDFADESGSLSHLVRYQWLMTSPDLTSSELWLNGVLLEVDPKDGSLPLPLTPEIIEEDVSPLILVPHSYAFVVLPQARAAACLANK